VTEQNSIVYKYHIFLIYSSIVGHLGCFLSLAIVNSLHFESYCWFPGFRCWFPSPDLWCVWHYYFKHVFLSFPFLPIVPINWSPYWCLNASLKLPSVFFILLLFLLLWSKNNKILILFSTWASLLLNPSSEFFRICVLWFHDFFLNFTMCWNSLYASFWYW
jgi:hypothetical protein